jgi:hypothetical protein
VPAVGEGCRATPSSAEAARNGSATSAPNRNDYPGDDGHPKTLFVAEHRVLPSVDEWLADLSSPEHIDATVAAILESDNHQSSEPAELR